LESEHSALCSMVELTASAGLDEVCWDLAVTLVTLFEAGSYLEDWEQTHRRALQAVRLAGNRRGAAVLLCSLSSLHLSRFRLAPAKKLLVPVLAEFTALGDLHGQAMARRNLALVHHLAGDVELALAGYRQASREFRLVGDPVGQAHVLSQIGQLELDAGKWQDGEVHLRRALAICHEVGSRRVEMQVRYRLSELMLVQGRYDQADAALAELLLAVRAAHDVVGEARILHRMGVVKARLGEVEPARRLLTNALVLREQTMDLSAAAEVRKELARLLRSGLA
jgi:tetratricopeptide (TPR) repeat protein